MGRVTWRVSAECPSCGSSLALRRHRTEHSLFVGCTAFPRCRFAEDYDEREGELIDRIAELEAALVVVGAHPPAEVLDKELRALVFAWHPDRQREPLTPHAVVWELTRVRALVRGSA